VADSGGDPGQRVADHRVHRGGAGGEGEHEQGQASAGDIHVEDLDVAGDYRQATREIGGQR
jgi:hypothetical protein